MLETSHYFVKLVLISYLFNIGRLKFVDKKRQLTIESCSIIIPFSNGNAKEKRGYLQQSEELRLGLNQLNDRADRRRVPLYDDDHPGNDAHWFQVFHICVSECSRNGSGVRPYLRVQENSSN